MCVNKDNSELTAKINEALTQLKEDGTLDAIVSNYIGDEAGQHPYTSPEGVDRSNGTLVMATNATLRIRRLSASILISRRLSVTCLVMT